MQLVRSTTRLSASRPVASASISRPSRVVVAASMPREAEASRRDALAMVALSFASLTAAAPAHAFLGIGEEKQIYEDYVKETDSVLKAVTAVLAIEKDAPNKEDEVLKLRHEINSWVAKYRREPKVSGRPSFGNTYSLLNALAGHYNSFGTTAPIPKKRLDRIQKELDDANLYLSRNR